MIGNAGLIGVLIATNIEVMRKVAQLLRDMVSAGVIADYAVFGAVAQMRYTEAVSTMDADLLVALPASSDLDILGPVEGEAIRVGEWPVQFIPAFSPLTEEAMREAHVAEIEGVPLRVVRADHLALIALSTGRPKDFARILSMVESGSVSLSVLEPLAARHGLATQLQRFKSRFLD